jgi:hypothetical protein
MPILYGGDKGVGVSPANEGLSAEQQADVFLSQFKPCIVEMIQRYDASNRAVRFDDIEADAASRGDSVARELMLLMLKRQGKATPTEIEQARSSAGPSSERSNMTRIYGKPRKLKTVRGAIEYKRDYLYFPDAHKGIFPPR